ncbi:MAG: trypsin-like peptidase domain-containing protein [Candidatus Binatia bacterium]
MILFDRSKLKVYSSLLFALFILCTKATASPIAKTWLRATAKIENEEGKTGTGFFVFREVKKNSGKIFLVTNKHVVNEDRQKRLAAQRLKIFVNLNGNSGTVEAADFEIPLIDDKGKPLWREHEDIHVDVLAVDIAHFVNRTPKLHKQLIRYTDFITPEIMEKQDVTIADEVLIVGYPAGLTHAKTNFPLVRQGLIATRIGERITLEVNDSTGKKTTVEIPGFLVDATVIGGSSGSPIILKPVRGFKITDGTNEATILPEKNPYLLGIISATRRGVFPVGRTKDGKDIVFPILEGLGIVYDADTIKETIELFFK